MEAYRVVFTSAAEGDLHDILDFIAADSPARATAFVDQLAERTINFLSTAPRGGPRFLGARYTVIRDYIVVYDIVDADQTVVVHMVTHGSRQWRTMFIERI